MATEVPWQISTMSKQIGSAYFHPSVKAKNLSYNFQISGPKVPSYVEQNGLISYPIGIQFNLADYPGHKVVVSLEPNDTYTIRLWKMNKNRGKVIGWVIDEMDDIYADVLEDIVVYIIEKNLKGG